jgi:hypothetical protein
MTRIADENTLRNMKLEEEESKERMRSSQATTRVDLARS